MKYIRCILTALAASAAGALAGSVWQTSVNLEEDDLPPPVITLSPEETSFTLRDYNGALALFRGNADSPYYILDYRTSFLTPCDRILVSEGITVETRKEANTLIEDLTG